MRNIAGNNRGVIAVEAALIFPVLILILLGCIDFGLWGMQATATQTGLFAGGQYVVNHNDTAGVQAAVINSNALLSHATVIVTAGSQVAITISVPFIGVTGLGLPMTVSASGSFTPKS